MGISKTTQNLAKSALKELYSDGFYKMYGHHSLPVFAQVEAIAKVLVNDSIFGYEVHPKKYGKPSFEYEGFKTAFRFPVLVDLDLEIMRSSDERSVVEKNMAYLYKEIIPSRDFHAKYAEEFYKIIRDNLNVEEAYEKLAKLNPNAIPYLKEVEYEGRKRNTLYGGRIHKQLKNVVEELVEEPFTRRAWMQILTPEDTELLKPLREGKFFIEFPCMSSIGFHIREEHIPSNVILDEKQKNSKPILSLNMNVILRSNNATLTMSYDLYNLLRLMEDVYKTLIVEYEFEKKHNVLLLPGAVHYYAFSMHVFEKDIPLAEKILSDFIDFCAKYPS